MFEISPGTPSVKETSICNKPVRFVIHCAAFSDLFFFSLKVNRMMECQLDAAQPLYNPHCWRIDGLPDMLDQGDLDEFSNDHEDLGPRGPWIEQNDPNVNYKWRQRGPRDSRLIQLAFHDCLRYSNSTVFIIFIITSY